MSENAEFEKRIRFLGELLKMAREQRFVKKCESLAGAAFSIRGEC
ncbi:TPA: hypothetical protein ACUKTJ_004294 [Escherichia coli]